jgi:hypothetical protein
LELSRWQLLQGKEANLPLVFLVVLVTWQTILFASFGLLAPRNLTVFVVLLLCTLSAAGAIFLLLEMGHPAAGIIKLPSASLVDVLSRMGKL